MTASRCSPRRARRAPRPATDAEGERWPEHDRRRQRQAGARHRPPDGGAGPFDPRLLRYARTTRRFVVLAIAVGGATALLVVAQAWLIATVVNEAFFHHGSLSSLRDPLGLLLAVIVGRAVLAWATERAAHRASASAKSELRHSAAEHIAALGPAGLDQPATAGASACSSRPASTPSTATSPATCPSSSWPSSSR